MNKKFCKTFNSKNNTIFLEDEINKFATRYELNIISSSICSHITNDIHNGEDVTFTAIVVFEGESFNEVKNSITADEILEQNRESEWQDIFNPNN